MVASKFLKVCRLLLIAPFAVALASCGPESEPPLRQAPAPELAPAQKVAASEDSDEAAVEVTQPDETIIRIAILLPLSGPEAATGQALLNAATMALFDAYDPRLTLLPFDTQADGLETEKAAMAAGDAGADIVLGPLLAGNVRIAGDVLGPRGVPILGFSNDSSVAAPGRYVLGFLPENEVQRVVDFAVTKGHRRFSALVPDGRYGNRVRAAFGDAVSDGSGQVMALESYPPDAEAVFEPVKALANYDERRKNLRDEINFLRSLDDDLTDEIADRLDRAEVLEPVEFDAVLVPEGGALLRTVGPLLPFYEIDPNQVQLLGTGLWNDPSLLSEPPLHGAWFAAPDPAMPTSFIDRYQALFGAVPPRIATIAYDGMSLVAALSRDTLQEGETRFSDYRLTGETGFLGLDGLFRLNPNGLNERLLSILEVSRRGFTVVDPAPDAFPSFGYPIRQAVSQE